MTVNNEGDDSATGENSRIDFLSEIQKLRTEKDEILKQIELKIDTLTEKLTEEQDKKFKELSEKLQSMENLVLKISKTDEDVETNENSDQADKTPEKLPNTNDSNVSKNSVPESEKRFVLKHVLKDVENFAERKFNFGDLESHFNVDSCVILQRLDDHLAFYVHIRGPKDETEWAVETKLNLQVIGPNEKSKVDVFNYRYEKSGGYGNPELLKWDEMKNEYLIDGRLTVEAHVEIIETSGLGKKKIRTFGESTKNDSDVILIVNKKEFYVSRKYLAAQSSFFKALLLGNFAESKKSKVTLTGIDPDDFHYFLEVLYGESAIDENNAEGILLLADMYDAPTATRRCENFLLNESEKPLEKKLQMAARYRLENLKNKCMEEIKTIDQISSVIPADINDLDHKLMGELLKKAILLH
ncbi:unnamed protein product [Caenorhabditis nigoni]